MSRRQTRKRQKRADIPPPDLGALRSAVLQTFPTSDPAMLQVVLGEVQKAVEWYVGLRDADLKQLTSAEIREELSKGQSLFSQVEKWLIATQPTAVRDYVLSGIKESSLPSRLIGVPNPDWRRELANVELWQSLTGKAHSLVRSDRGQPENYPLKQLAHDLAKIWQAHSERPFTNTKKGKQRPRDFVIAICQVVEPGVPEAEVEVAIRFAVSKLPGKRRGRKSGS